MSNTTNNNNHDHNNGINHNSNGNGHPPKLTPISELGEFGLIKHLSRKFALNNKSSIKGIGDDAAIIYNGDKATVTSTDMLVEGIHFDLIYCPLKHLGYKSVVVNLSDIYAMNAQPKQILVAIALSSRFTVEALDQIYEGIELACQNYGVDLVGGDTCSSQKGLIINITAIGQAIPDKIVYRNRAKAGDYICMTGDLGAAYLGLNLLEREKQMYLDNPTVAPDLNGYPYLIGRQLKPEARNDIIDVLNNMNVKPTAMIDISDGLSSDLLHICTQSEVGCRIFESNLPLHQQTVQAAKMFNVSPITCALNGGEDYELLFTISPNDIEKLEDTFGIAIIGRITEASEGYKLVTGGGKSHDLIAQGWKHI